MFTLFKVFMAKCILITFYIKAIKAQTSNHNIKMVNIQTSNHGMVAAHKSQE
jgi:hypothetical protein